MSEEEKKAIELLESLCSDDCINKDIIATVKNLIKKQQKEIEHELNQRKYWRDNFYKQQKEIEELKDINKKLEARKYMFNAITGEVKAIPIDNNYISKDKIREKIKEIKEIQNMAFTDIGQAVYNAEIVLLERLLEEN